MIEEEVQAACDRELELVNELADSSVIVAAVVPQLVEALQGAPRAPIDALADQLGRHLKKMERILDTMTPPVRAAAAQRIPEGFFREGSRLVDLARTTDARVKLAMRQGGQA